MDFADRETIGRNITYFRERRNISQQQLAEALEVSQPIVTRIENGERRIDVEEFQNIADVLGLDDLTRLVNRQRPARQLTYETLIERSTQSRQQLVMGLKGRDDPHSYDLKELGHLLLLGDTGNERLIALRQWMLQALNRFNGRVIIVEGENSPDFASLPEHDSLERYTSRSELADRMKQVQGEFDRRLKHRQDNQLETLYNEPPAELEPYLLVLNEAGEYWLPEGPERSDGIFDPIRRIVQGGSALGLHAVVSMREDQLADLPERLLGFFETRIMARFGDANTARELTGTEAAAYLPPGFALCWHNHRRETVQLPHLTPQEMQDILNHSK